MSSHAHPLGYRSPDVLIDGVRWHLAVYGRRMVYRFHDGHHAMGRKEAEGLTANTPI